MNIQHWSRQNRPLQRLLQQQQQWQRLQAFLNQKLPRNLSAHCSVACINEHGWLVVFAHNHLVAGRLKMLLPVHLTALQQLDSNIRGIEIKLRPVNQPKPKQIQRQFSYEALNSFDAAAEQVAHHQELAETLQRFASRRRKP